MTRTRSIDTLKIEVLEDDDGNETISVYRSTLTGTSPGVSFKKGDERAALMVLRPIAILMGVELEAE